MRASLNIGVVRMRQPNELHMKRLLDPLFGLLVGIPDLPSLPTTTSD